MWVNVPQRRLDRYDNRLVHRLIVPRGKQGSDVQWIEPPFPSPQPSHQLVEFGVGEEYADCPISPRYQESLITC